MITVLSSLPEAINLLSGLNSDVLTQLECPKNEYKNFLSATFQIFKDLSSELVNKSCPSEEKLTDLTAAL